LLNVAPTLSRYFRIIIPDIIGFGHSDKPIAEYSMDFFVRFLQAFLDKLNIEKAIICGHSFGGYLATEFAIRSSNRVEKLVLIAPVGITQSLTLVFDQYILAALFPTYENALKAFRNTAFDPRFVTEDSVRDFIRRITLPNAKYAFMSIFLGIRHSPNLLYRLPKIKSPSLIIWGENDNMTPPPGSRYLQQYQQNPNNAIAEINHCGHTPFVEKPIRFLAVLLKFLIEKNLYSRLYRQMTDEDREKEKNVHMCEKCNGCAQYGCLVECPLDRCLYGKGPFRIPKCALCKP
jgi:pimeloyl-ACP methyl ester carboxylesterase